MPHDRGSVMVSDAHPHEDVRRLPAGMLDAVRRADLTLRTGRVSRIGGVAVEALGPDCTVGELCEVHPRHGGDRCLAEVVALRDGRTVLMPLQPMTGVGLNDRIVARGERLRVPDGTRLLGRIVDALGQPIDDKAPPAPLPVDRAVHGPALNPLQRRPIDCVLETGVRAIDAFLTFGKGQRAGIFAGSGVGKSTLLGMLARHVRADVAVIALIGERGREVNEFIEQTLGSALGNSVVVVATADEPALRRVLAAHTATSIAESFADAGCDALLIMDSVTRYAMAQREIGLAAGEPATARGYTPSVFGRLPALFERAGAFRERGSISALYTVLVEGDDIHDPISDAVRSIVDGHIVLSRELANHGQYPAIDLLHSRSRLAAALQTDTERAIVGKALRTLAIYERSRDMVELGTYRAGTNPELDAAIALMPRLSAYLTQRVNEFQPRSAGLQRLQDLVSSIPSTAGAGHARRTER